ncbi:LuxR C-terminal-related transcriptional regulator [Nocardiopsis sp. FIRDI 009]|uniref:helix-turn-helix transcriptional regulator n=1 Tax=Nocardiopsis sp. FIRDI 009 TaxID=714197 RepID=UPI000E257BD9|nr:LuxR C-terminal-related transcriptional regulator [Nocardiopsis sp. FIRDI 009]
MSANRSGPMRPDDGDAFRLALRTARRGAGLPVAFGGVATEGGMRLTQFIGVRTNGLRGLRVAAASGLGGRVLVSRRPGAVDDYGSAASITHEYDGPVLAEGLRSVVAVPVVVSGAVAGVLYGASRGAVLGERATEALVGAARELAHELAVRDEVDRRLRWWRAARSNEGRLGCGAAAEEVRRVHARLRTLARRADDEGMRDELLDAARRLAELGADGAAEPDGDTWRVSPLSPRELDVLAQVALGCSNAEAGARLSLRPETVKAYLRSAMHKLGAGTRHEAVVAARGRGLLP